ncbi:MAG: Uma2 family endonuclease [Proteobacteria bacterium]|nr:Uma2 family endonuclease [Pseudomonadota bacterium]
MGNAAVRFSMSAEEFLAWEAGQADKHEFVAGEVFAMVGAVANHVTVSLNLAVALRQHLRGAPCRTFMSDMKLRVDQDFFYPDVFVTCGAADATAVQFMSEAKLVAEVLSVSTASYDLGAKFEAYRRLPTLAEAMFVNIEARRADVFRKGADGLWVLHPFGQGETVQLASVALDIPAPELFADVRDAG